MYGQIPTHKTSYISFLSLPSILFAKVETSRDHKCRKIVFNHSASQHLKHWKIYRIFRTKKTFSVQMSIYLVLTIKCMRSIERVNKWRNGADVQSSRQSWMIKFAFKWKLCRRHPINGKQIQWKMCVPKVINRSSQIVGISFCNSCWISAPAQQHMECKSNKFI